jgi:hypothetical protein
VVVALVALVTIETVGGAAAQALPATVSARSGVADQAIQLLNLVNADRANAGLAPVHPRADVAAIAQGWTAQMVAAGTLSHNDAYFSADTHQAIGAQAEGENVGFSGSMEAVELGFMNSPHHRANILDPRFTAIGIGVQQSSSGAWWVTQDFLQEAGAPAVDEPAPVPDEPAAARAAQPEPAAVVTAAETDAVPVSAPSDALPAPAPESTPAPDVALPAALGTAPDGSSMLLALPVRGSSDSGGEPAPHLVVLLAAVALLALDGISLIVSRRRRRPQFQ